jgi:hypothetical protein
LIIKELVFPGAGQANSVLQDNCCAIEARYMHWTSDASLLCDIALFAEGGQPPGWLDPSGFALDSDGHIAVNSFAQSPSYTTGAYGKCHAWLGNQGFGAGAAAQPTGGDRPSAAQKAAWDEAVGESTIVW